MLGLRGDLAAHTNMYKKGGNKEIFVYNPRVLKEFLVESVGS